MNTNELKAGRSYYYTAGAEWVKVTYKHKTKTGYLFTAGGADNELAKLHVEQYIEEL